MFCLHLTFEQFPTKICVYNCECPVITAAPSRPNVCSAPRISCEQSSPSQCIIPSSCVQPASSTRLSYEAEVGVTEEIKCILRRYQNNFHCRVLHVSLSLFSTNAFLHTNSYTSLSQWTLHRVCLNWGLYLKVYFAGDPSQCQTVPCLSW